MKCGDCPELEGGRMPADWKPRQHCCNSAEGRAARRAEEQRQRDRDKPANDQPNRAARRRAAKLRNRA
jgi:hypothetical protein